MWHAPFATVYNVTTADDLQQLIKHSNYMNKGKVYAFISPFLGRGILLSEGLKWKASRNVLAQFFHLNLLKNSLTSLESETDAFTHTLESFKGENVNLQKELARYIINTFCKVILQANFDSDIYLSIMTEIDSLLSERLGKLHMFIDLVNNLFGSGRQLQKLSKQIRKLTFDMIQAKKGKRNEEPKGLIEHLLNSNLDDQSICDEIDNLIFAGYDSTATTLSFILFQLALDDECQEKVFAEVSNTKCDYHDMKYLDCVIKEGMRLYPAVPKLHRTLTKSIICGNLQFAKGTEISINVIDIQRDPKYFPEPEKFLPDRFNAVDREDLNRYAYVPFSFGARSCLGKKFALLEMKIVLSKIVKSFKIIPVKQEKDIKFKTGFLLRSLEDFNVKFEKRITNE